MNPGVKGVRGLRLGLKASPLPGNASLLLYFSLAWTHPVDP